MRSPDPEPALRPTQGPGQDACECVLPARRQARLHLAGAEAGGRSTHGSPAAGRARGHSMPRRLRRGVTCVRATTGATARRRRPLLPPGDRQVCLSPRTAGNGRAAPSRTRSVGVAEGQAHQGSRHQFSGERREGTGHVQPHKGSGWSVRRSSTPWQSESPKRCLTLPDAVLVADGRGIDHLCLGSREVDAPLTRSDQPQIVECKQPPTIAPFWQGLAHDLAHLLLCQKPSPNQRAIRGTR